MSKTRVLSKIYILLIKKTFFYLSSVLSKTEKSTISLWCACFVLLLDGYQLVNIYLQTFSKPKLEEEKKNNSLEVN